MPDGAPLIDPDVVAGRIAQLLQDKRPGAVKPLLAALEKLAPTHRELAKLRAGYYCQIGDEAAALRVLDQEIADRPDEAMLKLQQAEIFFAQGEFGRSAEVAADAVITQPELARAKSVLGLALFSLGELDAALPCLAAGFAAEPAAVDVALALAALAPAQASEVLQAAIKARPDLGLLRNALARRYLKLGDVRSGGQVAAQARRDGVANAETFCLLAYAQMQEGHWEEARNSVAQAHILESENGSAKEWARRLGAALAARPSGRLEPAPVDEASERALIAGGTILPGSFQALLQEAQCEGPVLDLFCGAGLNAIAAQEISGGPWTGVDSSPAAMRICGARGVYARLELCRPREFLDAGEAYAAILLNEAFALEASPAFWFPLLRASLFSNGVALAAVAIGEAGMNGHGLFTHREADIAQQAAQAGLAMRVKRRGILRHIEGIPLHGIIASFQRI